MYGVFLKKSIVGEKFLQIIQNKLCHLGIQMQSGVAAVDAVVAVGVLHIVKLFVGLHKGFGKHH